VDGKADLPAIGTRNGVLILYAFSSVIDPSGTSAGIVGLTSISVVGLPPVPFLPGRPFSGPSVPRPDVILAGTPVSE